MLTSAGSLKQTWLLTICLYFPGIAFLLSSPRISSVQFSSVTQSCPTLCDPMNRSTPGLPVHHQLPEFTQINKSKPVAKDHGTWDKWLCSPDLFPHLSVVRSDHTLSEEGPVCSPPVSSVLSPPRHWAPSPTCPLSASSNRQVLLEVASCFFTLLLVLLLLTLSIPSQSVPHFTSSARQGNLPRWPWVKKAFSTYAKQPALTTLF